MNSRAYFFLAVWLSLVQFCWAQEAAAESCAEAKVQYFGRFFKEARARIAYPGDETIDVTYYHLKLGLTYTPKYLRGETLIQFKVKTPAISFNLDFSTVLKVDSVKWGNQRVQFSHSENRLTIAYPQPPSAGQNASVTIFYQGSPVAGGYGSFSFGTINQGKSQAIWTLSEPYGSSDWFPCKDNPADKADSSDVWVTAPNYFVSVSNGTLERTTTNADGTKTYFWKNRYAIAPYLISIACSNYALYTNYYRYSATDSMPITHYVQPDNLTASVKQNLDQTPKMLKLFSEKFGNYPFLKEKYGHAECGFSGGMEHQTCSSMGAYGQSLIAHELAHQWFGDKITCQSWDHIWLNEGFATYGEALWQEFNAGKTGYNSFIQLQSQRAKSAMGSVFVTNTSNISEIFNNNRSYAKGAMVLHMLRGIVGDAKFYQILRTYVASKHAYGNATTEDFQTVTEAVLGQKLDYFFKQWIYGEGFPSYEYGFAYELKNVNTYRLYLNLKQILRTTNPAYFTMPIPVQIKTTNVDTTVVVFNNQPEQQFVVDVKGRPTEVLLDNEGWILKNVAPLNLVTSIEEVVQDPQWKIYPNPATEHVTIEFRLKLPSRVIVKILDPNGQQIRLLTNDLYPTGTHFIKTTLFSIPTGLYLIHCEQGDETWTKKLVVR